MVSLCNALSATIQMTLTDQSATPPIAFTGREAVLDRADTEFVMSQRDGVSCMLHPTVSFPHPVSLAYYQCSSLSTSWPLLPTFPASIDALHSPVISVSYTYPVAQSPISSPFPSVYRPPPGVSSVISSRLVSVISLSLSLSPSLRSQTLRTLFASILSLSEAPHRFHPVVSALFLIVISHISLNLQLYLILVPGTLP